MRLTTAALQGLQEAGIYTAAHLAELTGISAATAGKAINGQRISADTAGAIAAVIGLTAGDVLQFEEKDGILAEQAAIATQINSLAITVAELQRRLGEVAQRAEMEITR